jgi:hypothetical protein
LRPVGRGRSALAVALLLAVALPAGAWTREALAAGAGHKKSVVVEVAACPIPAADYAGTPYSPAAAPATLAVPASLAPPAGARLYGAAFPASPPSYVVGGTPSTCQGLWGSADDGEILTVTPSSTRSPQVSVVLRPGGAGPETDLACPYIPAVLAVDRAFRGNAKECARPSADVVKQLATGVTGVYAAAVWVPATVKDPNLGASGNGKDPTVALYVARVVPRVAGNASATAQAQTIDCTYPPPRRAICTASLRFFLATQVDVGARIGPAHLTAMQRALAGFLHKR